MSRYSSVHMSWQVYWLWNIVQHWKSVGHWNKCNIFLQFNRVTVATRSTNQASVVSGILICANCFRIPCVFGSNCVVARLCLGKNVLEHEDSSQGLFSFHCPTHLFFHCFINVAGASFSPFHAGAPGWVAHHESSLHVGAGSHQWKLFHRCLRHPTSTLQGSCYDSY